MKELTIEEKAKCYDEAIERAKTKLTDEVAYSIFPELRKSEDEKVKKSLIRLIKAFYDVNFPTPEGFTKEQLLSWLEKQGEQKSNPCENCDIATNNCKKFPCSIRDGEQKPANWLQEFEDKLANATPKQLAEWKEKYFKEEPAEWSEEDERMCQYVVNDLRFVKILVKDPNYAVNVESVEKEIDWLKSIRGRFTWKPSDEHYELEEFAKIVRCNLTGISKAVQELFKAKYLQLTGIKMYGGFKD